MSEATFRGGVHPYEGKELSSDLPIKTVMPTGEMVFPMGQHIGAPATPIVAKGDKVLVDKKLAKPVVLFLQISAARFLEQLRR